MLRGRLTASNDGPTTGFRTLAEIKAAPAEGQWTEFTPPEDDHGGK